MKKDGADSSNARHAVHFAGFPRKRHAAITPRASPIQPARFTPLRRLYARGDHGQHSDVGDRGRAMEVPVK